MATVTIEDIVASSAIERVITAGANLRGAARSARVAGNICCSRGQDTHCLGTTGEERPAPGSGATYRFAAERDRSVGYRNGAAGLCSAIEGRGGTSCLC